jgi:predicted amidophosphoribosyltransferase
VAKELKLPLLLDSCSRYKDTAHQTQLTASARRNNVRNCFRLNRPVTFKHVAILDDVMTTGATLNELALTLKAAGISQVDAWVCARA